MENGPHGQGAFGAALADEFRRRRQAMGLSLNDLAQKSGIERAVLEGLESGSGVADLSLIEQVAGFLGCSLSVMLVARSSEDRERGTNSLSHAIWPV